MTLLLLVSGNLAIATYAWGSGGLAYGPKVLKLIWTQRTSIEGWGCSECAWVFHPSGRPVGDTFEEMKRNFRKQLAEEFASHACADHARSKAAKDIS